MRARTIIISTLTNAIVAALATIPMTWLGAPAWACVGTLATVFFLLGALDYAAVLIVAAVRRTPEEK